jgi:hypothetical protein
MFRTWATARALAAALLVAGTITVDIDAADGASVLFIYDNQEVLNIPRYPYSVPAVPSAEEADGDFTVFAFTVRRRDIVLEFAVIEGVEGDLEPFTLDITDLDEGRPIRNVIVDSPIPLEVAFTDTSVTLTHLAAEVVPPGVITVQIVRGPRGE